MSIQALMAATKVDADQPFLCYEDCRVLILGCGNSTFGEDMIRDGWKGPITNIDLASINDYDYYLRSVRQCNNNSTIKYIRNFGKIVKQCFANGWIARDPFLNYKGKVKQIDRNYLTEEELQIIIDKDISIERLTLVRDIFIFSCFTGLAYIDVKNLNQWVLMERNGYTFTVKKPIRLREFHYYKYPKEF